MPVFAPNVPMFESKLEFRDGLQYFKGDTIYIKNNRLHNPKRPALVTKYGEQCWFYHGNDVTNRVRELIAEGAVHVVATSPVVQLSKDSAFTIEMEFANLSEGIHEDVRRRFAYFTGKYYSGGTSTGKSQVNLEYTRSILELIHNKSYDFIVKRI